MHLSLRERERIELFQIAQFARRRLDRGARISAPEAIAVVCDELLELAWDGHALADVVEAAYSIVRPDQLMPGVANAVPHIQVEALFPQGTALVAVDWPFGRPGSDGPGALDLLEGEIELNAGRAVITLSVHNSSNRAVYVSSHFPFADVNSDLQFDREAAAGMRLNIPAGTSETFEPGSTHDVELILIRRASAPQEA